MNSRLALILAGGALALSAGPAAAATSLGQVAPAAATGGCTNCGMLQTQTAPGSAPYVVPAGGGVITSWSFRDTSKATAARLRLFAPGAGPGEYTLIAQTPYRNFALGEAGPTQTQIPVAAGVHLGIAVTAADQAYYTYNDGDTVGGNFDVAAPIGASALVGNFGQRHVNIAAILEPDADHDGYGDETQDGCPSDPTVQTKCPPAPAGSQQPSTPQSSPATTTQAGPLVSLVTPARESIKTGYVIVSATSAGKVTVSATGRIGSSKLRSATKTLQTGGRATLKLKIPKKTLRAIRLRLAHHRKVSAKVTVSAGGSTTPVTIRLVR